MPVWPGFLGSPLADDYRLERVDTAVRTPVEAGPPIVRQRTSWSGPRVTATWSWRDPEAAAFDLWWSVEARNGSRPFVWYEPSRGIPGRWIFSRPPAWRRTAQQLWSVELELLALEEWWPPAVTPAGKTIRLWDPSYGAWAGADVRARHGSKVVGWDDRQIAFQLAATPVLAPVLREDDDAQWLALDPGQAGYLESTGLSVSRSGCAIAIGISAETSDSYTVPPRVVTIFNPAAPTDDQSAQSLLVRLQSASTVQVVAPISPSSAITATWTASGPLSRVAILATSSSSSLELRVDGVVRASATPGPTGQTGNTVRVMAGTISAVPNGYWHGRLYGLAICPDWVPSPLATRVLTRWAAALAGRDLDD